MNGRGVADALLARKAHDLAADLPVILADLLGRGVLIRLVGVLRICVKRELQPIRISPELLERLKYSLSDEKSRLLGRNS